MQDRYKSVVKAEPFLVLTEKQIKYAATDTEFLPEIKNKLTKMLIREKRMELFDQCMKVLPIIVQLDLEGYNIDIFNH